MAFKLPNRVRQTSTTTGTGPYTFSGSVNTWQEFADDFVTGDTTWYVAWDPIGTDFEVGLGTYNAGGGLDRTTILESSNGNAAVSWLAGARHVAVVAPGAAIILLYYLTAAAVTVSSATTTNIGAAQSILVNVSGTTTITGLGTAAAGIWRLVKFAGALTLTHNGTSLILPGGESIVTAAGDSMFAESLGSGNWKVWFYHRGTGAALKAIQSDLTLWVRSDAASDDTDGLEDTPERAFQNWQPAIDFAARYDFNNHGVIIRAGDEVGTKTWNISEALVVPRLQGWGVSRLNLVGNGADTVIESSSSNGTIVLDDTGLPVFVGPITLSCSNATAYGVIVVLYRSQLAFQDIGPIFAESACAHFWVHDNLAQARILNSEYGITGGAPRHITVTNGANFFYEGNTVNISGTPDFSDAFAVAAAGGTLQTSACDFGAGKALVTGNRWRTTANGVINPEGEAEDYFPGDAPGGGTGGGAYLDTIFHTTHFFDTIKAGDTMESRVATGDANFRSNNFVNAPAGVFSARIQDGAGLLEIRQNGGHNQAAVYLLSGDTSVYLLGGGGDWIAATTTPASGKCSVAWDGSGFSVYSQLASTVDFYYGAFAA